MAARGGCAAVVVGADTIIICAWLVDSSLDCEVCIGSFKGKHPLEHGRNYTWLRILFLKISENVKTFQFFPNKLELSFLAYKYVLQRNIP
jgi:hypothetical protein